MLENIFNWAKSEELIRAVILVGSRAENKHVDALSDYDLSIFSRSDTLFTNDQWISKIGHPWVCVHEKVYYRNREFPSRLVIFEGGAKVDFSLFSLEVLNELANASFLPFEYDRGYQALLDKDGVTEKMVKPSFKALTNKKPNEQEFLNVVNEFWFEAYHVAVYLKRGDLWSAKFRAHGIYDHFLLKMIEWSELAKLQWKEAIPPIGKRMQLWVGKSTWEALHHIFAHFDSQDSWSALVNTMTLFRNLATDLAEKLCFNYPIDRDNHISGFIFNLRDH